MELRHLRCFMAVAEELHFARAAERLHIDQSPLSRTIKELEEDLGAPLFLRNTRSTRLTRAGKLFLEHMPRVFAALDQARASVQAASAGFHGQLRIALSDGIMPSRSGCATNESTVSVGAVLLHATQSSVVKPKLNLFTAHPPATQSVYPNSHLLSERKARSGVIRLMKCRNCSEGSLSGPSRYVISITARPASGRATTSGWRKSSICVALVRPMP